MDRNLAALRRAMAGTWHCVRRVCALAGGPAGSPAKKVAGTGKRAEAQLGALKNDIVRAETANAREIEESGATNLTQLISRRNGRVNDLKRVDISRGAARA